MNEKIECGTVMRRIAGVEESRRLEMVAAEDEHVVVGATHLIERDGEIVGYASVGSVVVVNAWASTKKMGALQSVRCLRQAEGLARGMGFESVCLPVAERSPFLPVVERLGYQKLGWAMFNLKKL